MPRRKKNPILGHHHVEGKKPDYVKAEKAFGDFLSALQIDWAHDPNMVDTPKRVSKMYIEELFAGRYEDPPPITTFKTDYKHDALQMIGPIHMKSMCAHHTMPIVGKTFIGVLPRSGQALPGLSKFGRVMHWFARRPTIQEDLVEQIADYLYDQLNPLGLAVRISAWHGCCSHRGLNDENMKFVTTALRGDLLTNSEVKREFLMECSMATQTGLL